jgi:capsular polysaccharide transport system permease protein
MPSLLKSGALQIRVIAALLLRELNTRFGRENIGFFWFVGEPILFCGGVSILWTAIRPPYENGIPMTAFVVTGYIPLTLWRHCVGRALKAYESNAALLFHRQVTPMDIIITRVILEVIGTLIAGLIVIVGAIGLGYMKPPVDYGLMYAGFGYQIAFSLACSLLIASLSEMSELVEKFLTVLMYLSLPLSGAFTMVSWLPSSMQKLVLYSPSVHAIEMIRAGAFGNSVQAIYSYTYATYSIGIMIALGVFLTSRVRKYIVVT